MNIALYPGAFKPPTKGHLGVVKQVLSGKYNTAKVDRDTGKYEKSTDNPKMDQVWIIVGDMVKGGPDKQKGSEPEVAVGQDEAIKVWEEYLKANGLEGSVKLFRAGQVREDILNEDVGYVCEGANPVRDTYGLLKDKYVRGEYEGTNFFPIVGFRPDNAEAIKDLQRMDAASRKYGDEGLQILVVLDEPTPGEESVSATKLRAALAAKDKSKIEKYAAASANALLKHFTKQDELDQAIAEAMMKAVHDMLSAEVPPNKALKEAAVKYKEEVKESNRDMPSPEVEDIATPPSEFTNKLEYHKEYFQNLTSFPVTVDKYQNIVIQTGQRLPMNEVLDLSEVTSQELNFTPFLSSILEFMLDKKMRITPIPNIEIKMDIDAATDVFGPTAYYDPSSATVCLYTLGRHPKDILRSFCHEMIHHMQNMEGRLPAFSTTNTQEDSDLNEIEKEAHALGSMTFREWEDTVKNNFDVVKEQRDIDEVGDASAKPYKWTREQSQISQKDLDVTYNFTTDTGIHYTAYLNDYNSTGVYYFGFFTDKRKEDQGDAELTNEGNPLRVMATIVEILKDFLSAIPGVGIRYYADDAYTGDKRRAKLYKAYIAKHMPSNYKVNNVTDLYVEILPKEKEKVLAEGKYDKLTNTLSSIAFEQFRDIIERGDKVGEFIFNVGPEEDDNTDIPHPKMEFQFLGKLEVTDGEYEVDGGANAEDEDEDGDIVDPFITVNFKIPRNIGSGKVTWERLSFDLKDVVRHELEHLTQAGPNTVGGKAMEDDMALRAMIDANLLPKASYFQLEKEIDAMIQGLYLKAKKSKRPFKEVVEEYLKMQPVNKEEKEEILALWRKRLPALGIKKEYWF